MLDIAKTILEVGKGLFGLRSDFGKTRRDRRGRLAAYFSDLAALVESVCASLREKKYPHGSCAQLQRLASMMKKTVKGIVPDQDAQEFQDKLMHVWEIEQLFGKLQTMPGAKAKKELTKLPVISALSRRIFV